MKTLTDLTKAKNKLSEIKKNAQNTYGRKTGVNPKQINIINENFISFDCENLMDVKNVINSIKPFKNGWKITDGVYITSLYKIDICNDYHDRSFRIIFESKSGCVFWANIDFKFLPDDFKCKFFTEHTRGLYDTETVYINIPSHYKKFKNIRIKAYSFNKEQVNFYGGNKVLVFEPEIKKIINYIKKTI